MSDSPAAPTASSNTPVTAPPTAVRTAPVPNIVSSPAVDAGAEGRQTSPVPVRAPVPDNPQALLARLTSRWAELPRQALRDFQVALGTALTDSRPVGLSGGTLTVEMPADFCTAHGDDPVVRSHLAGLVERIAGTRLELVLRPRTTGGDVRGRRYQTAAEHPLVKELVTRFEADILAREVMNAEEWRARLKPR